MAKWNKIEEVRDNGYYIGWFREHPKIHESRKSPYVWGKHSLVQIGGSSGLYEVLGQTVIHPVFAKPGEKGIIFFKEESYTKTLKQAIQKASSLKRKLAKRFDKLTRD